MIHKYFQHISKIMAAESEMLQIFYKRHHGKLGEGREILLQRFLSTYLPKRFGVGSGFALLSGTDISTEQDIVIYDALNNPVFFSECRSAIFPPSAIQALIEVKSSLNKTELKKTVQKTSLVKQELRKAPSILVLESPRLMEPLVCLFAYSGSDLSSIKETLISLQRDITETDRLDLVCILNEGVISSGTYFNVSIFGEPNSLYARSMTPERRNEILTKYPDKVLAYRLRENSLLIFYYWLLSYIIRRPVIIPDIIRYAPSDYVWGEEC
ncbi:hypothetical protein DRO38_06260 [Candidatus Bathyarchaeota archaeon]|nr:MAG: hypothetical protein DRO38_06260 [Candidatus Bathyarchaeota archaeon]HDN58832.1 hypothetical protein [Candidatus Neomarinimicrobiota bacterium]